MPSANRFLLASQSPRRKELLIAANINFEVVNVQVEEIFPEDLNRHDVPVFLSELKSRSYSPPLPDNTLLITADTVVIFQDQILGKPTSEQDAKDTLSRLSGKDHLVVTGVTLRSNVKTFSFSETTVVTFDHLSEETIVHYIKNYQPFDKAGSYGIQEYIGHVGVKSISGSYDNVVGMPVNSLLRHLSKEF